MNNKRNTMLALIILFIGLIIVGGSYGYFTWISTVNKNVFLNTTSNLKKYIVYDEGDSRFVGDFKIGSTYTDGIYSTLSVYKTQEAANANLVATIYGT